LKIRPLSEFTCVTINRLVDFTDKSVDDRRALGEVFHTGDRRWEWSQDGNLCENERQIDNAHRSGYHMGSGNRPSENVGALETTAALAGY
jgi:hypothetical protein